MLPRVIIVLFSLLMPFLPTFDNSETKPKEELAKKGFDRVGSSGANDIVINVSDYGATDGGADATLAFEKAWKAACSATEPATLVVSDKKTYLLKAITFSGPCKSKVYLQIEGTIEASSNTADWSSENRTMWMLFSNIDNLIVGGGGTINGNGQVWWPKSCKIDKSQPCTVAPTALTFRSCNYLTVKNLNVKNSPQIHIKFDTCRNVTAASINIEAPETSPNTDGIQVAVTKYIQINHCNIGTGDDCIAIVNGSQGVKITSTVCGPGHGISIGSLGTNNSEAYVSDVTVDTAQLRGTTNGVRIKTWQGGKGNAKNIIFQNINIDDVQNPIIIDQNYCDKTTPCKQQSSAVQISHVHYKNIKGTSGSTYATNFNCSSSFPCNHIVLEDINITATGDVPAVKSFCNNVRWRTIGTVIPTPCKLNHIHEFGLPYFGHLDPVDDH